MGEKEFPDETDRKDGAGELSKEELDTVAGGIVEIDFGMIQDGWVLHYRPGTGILVAYMRRNASGNMEYIGCQS